MITHLQEKFVTGTGLGYQISAYYLMRNICKATGYTWVIADSNYKALRNTFDINIEINNDFVAENVLQVADLEVFSEIINNIADNTLLECFPTPNSWYVNEEYENEIKSELVFKDNIRTICQEFRDRFDGEVIAMQIRAGEFANVIYNHYLCDFRYYSAALAELPTDLPVLVFTDDKDYATEIINQFDDTSRFTLITDLFNNNEWIDDEVGKRMDKYVDFDGSCKYDYLQALYKMAYEDLGNDANTDHILEKTREYVAGLSSQYRDKMRQNIYNHSLDFCLMTMCDYLLMSNSTFGLWAATLKDYTKVVYPSHWLIEEQNTTGDNGEQDDVVILDSHGGTTIATSTNLINPRYGQILIMDDERDQMDVYNLTRLKNRENWVKVFNPEPRAIEVVGF
jgi:hypothetical protein